MNLQCTVYLIFLNLISGNCFNFNITCNLINDFLIAKEQNDAISFTCFKPKENVRLMKTMSESNIRLVIDSHANFTRFRNVISQSSRISFILDLTCNNVRDVLIDAKKRNFYQFNHKWLLLDLENPTFNADSKSIIEHFEDVSFRMDSDVTIAIADSLDNISLFDVYNTNYNSFQTPIVTSLGQWTSYGRKTVDFPYEQRKIMENITLKWAIVCLDQKSAFSNSIDFYFNDEKRRNFDTINRFSYNLFKHVQEIHKFNAELTLADKWFGDSIYGGVDGGVSKLLHEKKIDFAVSSGKLQIDRIPVIDFVAPVYPFTCSFIFRNVGLSNKLQNEFLKPFSMSVWFYILGFTGIFCLIFKCIFKFNQLSATSNDERSWSSTCVLILAVLCQQGSSFVPKPISGQFTLLSLLIMSLLLYNYYTSSIVSSLLRGLPPPFSTVDELSHSTLKLGLQDTPYIRTLFQVSTDPSIKYLYKHKVLQQNGQPLFLIVHDGIARVQQGGFAYHVESPAAYAIIEKKFEPNEICDLAEIFILEQSTLWIMTQKRSQYKKLFAIGYLKMLERGIIFRQQAKWITKKPSCLSNALLVKVDILQLVPAFMLLLFGSILSIFLLIIELIFTSERFKNYIRKILYLKNHI